MSIRDWKTSAKLAPGAGLEPAAKSRIIAEQYGTWRDSGSLAGLKNQRIAGDGANQARSVKLFGGAP